MSSDTVAVIGGGPGGLRAAHAIAENYAGLTPHGEPAGPQIQQMIEAVTSHPGTDVRLGSEVTALSGDPGSFTLTVRGPAGEQPAECGAIVLATGFTHFDPGRETQLYGYYEYPDVITLPDLESMLSQHQVVRPSNGQPPERVCFIQCVGSRDRHIGNEYCSKVCCGVASKEAIEVRQLIPGSKVYIFYIDMRMYGYWENEIYWPAQEKHHVQYVKGMITEVIAKGDRLLVRGEDTTMGRPMELEMDMVVLSVGMEPSAGTKRMAKVLGVGQNKYGFIHAVGGPLDTVSTSRPGIFACGAALGPADLEDTVSSAAGAAMKAVGFLRQRAASAS